ncbi:MAG: twitching motility protein PilJ [Pseudohongiellaceae bacterium]|jgi:twitching motility protein PilJ
MKFNNSVFRSKFWVPGLIISAIGFLLLSFYLGFQLQQNDREDADNIQSLSEIDSSIVNAEFFIYDIVKGDTSAIDPLNLTLAGIQNNLKILAAASKTTRNRVASELAQVSDLWEAIGNDVEVLVDAEVAINLVNSVSGYLSAGATDAEQVVLFAVASLAAAGAPKYQINAISRQAFLLQDMSNKINLFIREEAASRGPIDKLQDDLAEYQSNNELLTRGTTNKGPITDPQILNGLQIINAFEQVIGAQDTVNERPFFPSIKKIIAAKQAQSRLSTSFGAMRSNLSTIDANIKVLTDKRFPQWLHIIVAGLGFLIAITGLVIVQRINAMYEIDRQQKDSQRTQEAILRLLDELIDLADGDLTISATVSEDFTGAIADSINFTIDQLRQLVSRINSTAVQVSQAAQSTQQTAYHLAEASNHQAQEIAGASAAINEMAVTIDQVSANASESALVAGKSVSIANNGAKLVQNTINGMDTIREQIQDTSKRIKRLGESSQEIGDIVSLINDIADQTNILALNAAIQASMAGDAGRGFAVVADEVQRLAERSAAATKQIGSLVKAIQSDTNEAVISMEQTTSEVVRGARLAQDAGVALEEIEGVSANLAELIQNISSAARQQAASAGHISNTMNVIQEITSQTTAGTGETAHSIGNLADMASELRQSVAGFTLPDEMLADLQLQEISAARVTPPVLENIVSSAPRLSPYAGSSPTNKILSDLDFSDGNDSKSLFSRLADNEDLLDEFDIDLSDVQFPDKSSKPVR